jgi:hypothetical protein
VVRAAGTVAAAPASATTAVAAVVVAAVSRVVASVSATVVSPADEEVATSRPTRRAAATARPTRTLRLSVILFTSFFLSLFTGSFPCSVVSILQYTTLSFYYLFNKISP